MNFVHFLVAEREWDLEGEMQDGDELVLGAWLEEGMLDVPERNVDLKALGGDVAEAVLVKLEVTNCLER